MDRAGAGDGVAVALCSPSLAADLEARLDAPVDRVTDAAAALDTLSPGDCLLTPFDRSGDPGPAVIDAAHESVEDVAAVLFALAEPSASSAALAAGATLVVDPTDDGDLAALANRVRAELRRIESNGDRSAAVRDLHETATSFGDCDSREAVYEHTVAAAEETLALDYCLLDTVEGDVLEVRATSSGLDPEEYESVPIDEGGLAGAAVREDEPSIVDDISDSPVANGDHDYRSILTVPAGDLLFQAGAERVGAFDDADLELVELLLSHATESLERIDTERELRERERFLSTLLDNLPGMVYRCVNDPGWPMTFVSEGSRQLTGYAPEELIEGDVVWGEDVLLESETDRLWEVVQEAIDNREPFEVTYRIRTADGETRWVWEQGRAVDEDGEVILEGFITDISDRKETEAELREQRERLEAFARIVSHDLRNPLTVATGHLEAVREATDGADEHLDGIERAHERINDIVEGVLALARDRSSVDDDTPVSLADVAEDAWATVDTAEMSLSSPDESAIVYADRSLLRQAFENLFRNACEHAGRDVTVTVGRLADESGFFVADDGPNLPEALRGSAFELGVADGETSTGTGLAIVRRVADAHDWSVSHAESEAGGARFEFRTQ
jgi:PAS domain S-box-containing protein